MNIQKFKDFTNEGIKHEYGCVMLYFDIPNWNGILKKINKDDLYTAEEGHGLETEAHITLLWGVYGSVDTKDVKSVVEHLEQPYVTFKDISIFSNPLSKYDVVKLVPECELLYSINESLKYMLPHVETFPVYNPHMTIAYVKYGRGVNYIQTLEEPIIIKPTKIVYSEPNKNKKNKVDLLVW